MALATEAADADTRAESLVPEILYADVEEAVQEQIVRIAVEAVDKLVFVPTRKPWAKMPEEKKLLEREIERTQMQALAQHIKTEVDSRLDGAWHVVYGRSFATFVTHESSSFVHFKLSGADVVVWKHG